MKKKKRILRTVISTMLMCCMLVGDLGSVFATSVGSSVVSEQSSEEQGSTKEVQTLAEPVEESDLGMQGEQSSSELDTSVVEEPKVEVEPDVETPVETPEVKPEVVPESTPEAEPEQPEVKPEPEKPVEKPEVKPESEEKPVEKPNDNVPSEQPEADVPTEEPSEPSVDVTTPSETDNWSLDLVFYDSTVDGGKTPLKSIDWDASDGGYDEGESRTITVQINYKNTNAVTTYQPGGVSISVSNMLYNLNTYGGNDCCLRWSVVFGANDENHTGYNWNLEKQSSSVSDCSLFTFTNDVTFEEGSNFEGSINFQYILTPWRCEVKEYNSVELGKDFCERSLDFDIKASLYNNGSLKLLSKELPFKYRRKYIHPWNYKNPSHKQSITKIDSFDGLNNVPVNSYYWVKVKLKGYNFLSQSTGFSYPNIGITYKTGFYDIKNISKNCLVYDLKGNKIFFSEDRFRLPASAIANPNYNYEDADAIIGFPKDEYINTSVTLVSDLYGMFPTKSKEDFFGTAETTFDLADYEYSPGELYSFRKSTGDSLRYQDVMGGFGKNNSTFFLSSNIVYTGTPYTLVIGDDLLFRTNYGSDNVSRLEDNEYKFRYVALDSFRNFNGSVFQEGKYNCELWVRFENQQTFELYSSFKYSSNKRFDFSRVEKSVVGFYFIIKDVTESIKSSGVNAEFVLNASENLSEQGYIYNFGYSQVFFKDNNGELILQNESTEENYPSLKFIDKVKQYDLNTFGKYIQRDYDSVQWYYYEMIPFTGKVLSAEEVSNQIIQDQSSQKFVGTATSALFFNSNYVDYFNEAYLKGYGKENYYFGGYLYDLLPYGAKLESSKKEIVDSIIGYMYEYGYNITDLNSFWFELISYNEGVVSAKELIRLMRENSDIIVIENWNNTGRTLIKLKLDLSNNPILACGNNSSCKYFGLGFNYRYSIPYDEYISQGNNFKHFCFSEPIENDRNKGVSCENSKSDEFDLNENGITTDLLSVDYSNINITSVISTNQDVQTSVQTDKSNYSTGLVKASPESEYSYKLRARSGSNQVSNLVLVNNIEEGYGKNEHWKGEFLGIDTSFAENRTYRVYKPSDPRADAEGYVQEKVKVKPYYSTSTTEGELYQTEEKVITDPSGEQIVQRVRVVDEHGNFVKNPNWLEYSDSVDKSTVKSLAFEFLDAETGEQAILPENNLIYVEVKMKAPVEADGLTADDKAKYAYNNCFTQWNALDSMGQAVDFITGINSNTVKVTVNDRVSVQINKVWEDEENKYNTRPDTVEFIMKKDGEEVDRQTLEKGKTAVTFSGLLVDELSTYTFEEVCPSGYTTEGVIYDKVTDTYTATNTLDPSSLVEVKGTKTWVGDLESERPESITVNLYRNDTKIDSKVVRASDGWSYDFGKFIKNDPDGNEYVYRIEEEPVEGYIASYAPAENGLNITFNSQCKTESATYDYVEIYYKGSDSKTYKLGKWGGTALAGKVVGVPSRDFWLYWRTDSSDCSYYGFSIDSIESANVEATGTVATLPNYAVEEVSGSTYPDSAFDGHTHGNYGNSVNKVWHYTTGVSGFNITNTSNMIDISGQKYWEDAETIQPESIASTMESTRPASITVNLLQDGVKIDSTTTDASKGWKYSFTASRFDDTGKEYVYSVEEEPVEGYIPSYSGSGSRIHFSDFSRTESYNYDFVKIYYMYKGNLYSTSNLGGSSISGMTVDIPATEFYVYWNTDSSDENYYGYKIDSVEGIMLSEPLNGNNQESNLPCEFKEANSISDLQSNHNPYGNNVEELWKYSIGSGLYDITNFIDNIELRFTKLFNVGTYDSMMGFQHDGISFTLYENTLENGYPEAFPGTSDEWRKVGELNKYELGGDYINTFLNEYYIDGLKSNKEYFLVENVNNLMVNYLNYPDGNLTAGYNVSTESIKGSCYVVETGLGTINNIFLTVYGYSNTGKYKPSDKHDYFRDFCEYYGGYEEGTSLHSFLDSMSSKYPVIQSDELVYSLQPMKFEDVGSWVIPNILETKRIGVTKKIKASDINFDNGNPTFIFEARVSEFIGYDLKSFESEMYDSLDVLDIKYIEFTKEYVEANTDSEGYVSKTVYFDKMLTNDLVAVAERVSSRYGCSSITVDGHIITSLIDNDMGVVISEFNPFIETNITFTNEKYENQYYSHNDIVVNEIKRNKTSMAEVW